MSDEKQGEQATQVAKRAKPELVTIGDRQVISNGRWNDDLMVSYVLANGRDKWLSIGDLAKVAYCANTVHTKKNARVRVRSLFLNLMLRHGEILLVDYEPPHGRAQAVKIFNKDSELDRKSVVARIEKMRSKRESAAGELDAAMRIIEHIWPDDVEQVFDIPDSQES
jgi:hypothetical protein